VPASTLFARAASNVARATSRVEHFDRIDKVLDPASPVKMLREELV
jgi:hypothetical protein